MKKTVYFSAFLMATLLLSFSCNPGETKENKENETADTIVVEKITVTPIDHSKAFPEAVLEVSSIKAKELNADSVELSVAYKVSNFTLTEHTDDHHAQMMANSHDGQHIHFILNNEPYSALYKPEHQVKLKKGTTHSLLSFLSRSYHESIKEEKAFVINQFEITEKGKLVTLPADTLPMLFYSRPKGEYKGAETKSVLLDFYLSNVELGEQGVKVKADINGETFLLNSWQPYIIEFLPLGESTIILTLVDNEGNKLEGTHTTISRTIKLSE